MKYLALILIMLCGCATKLSPKQKEDNRRLSAEIETKVCLWVYQLSQDPNYFKEYQNERFGRNQ
jgi:hypothetical protein